MFLCVRLRVARAAVLRLEANANTRRKQRAAPRGGGMANLKLRCAAAALAGADLCAARQEQMLKRQA